MESIQAAKKWYDASYSEHGLDAQRRYPNEELLRFMGRNFFCIPRAERSNCNILEIGAGSCANLWMVAREGYKAHGLDISQEALNLGQQMLASWGAVAVLQQGSMTSIPWDDGMFDAVLDVFSSNCLKEEDFQSCLGEVSRVLKPRGLFFSYTPGKASDAFQHHKPAAIIDASTLDGIRRPGSPFWGNNYPFRFIHPDEYREMLEVQGFEVTYLETVRRSYNSRNEVFEHVVAEARKR